MLSSTRARWKSRFISSSWIQLIPWRPCPTLPPKPQRAIAARRGRAPPLRPSTKLVRTMTLRIFGSAASAKALSHALPTVGAKPTPKAASSSHSKEGGSPWMWAVDICTQIFGGFATARSACPSTRVDSTRDRRISSLCSGVLMQSTVRPVKFTKAVAPSRQPDQSPRVRASQRSRFRGVSAEACRESRITSQPACSRCCARFKPRKPVPPAMTIRPLGCISKA